MYKKETTTQVKQTLTTCSAPNQRQCLVPVYVDACMFLATPSAIRLQLGPLRLAKLPLFSKYHLSSKSYAWNRRFRLVSRLWVLLERIANQCLRCFWCQTADSLEPNQNVLLQAIQSWTKSKNQMNKWDQEKPHIFNLNCTPIFQFDLSNVLTTNLGCCIVNFKAPAFIGPH